MGTNLEIAYYDQLRERLDEEKTVHQRRMVQRASFERGCLRDFLVAVGRCAHERDLARVAAQATDSSEISTPHT